ncbi:MAG: hypothetical protein ACREIW_02430, partial [Chthoniobacterales bacterium]
MADGRANGRQSALDFLGHSGGSRRMKHVLKHVFSGSSSDIGTAGIIRCRLGSRDRKIFPEPTRDAHTRRAFPHPQSLQPYPGFS